MNRFFALLIAALLPLTVHAADLSDQQATIESQHKADPELMKRGVDEQLAKRTYWQVADGSEFIMKTDYEHAMQ